MSDSYINPLCTRYASKEMQRIFSDDAKFSTWRRLWIALAEAEKSLGLDITDAQIAEMKAHIDDINYDDAAAFEKETRHDVMAHIKAYGKQCPNAKGIIHLGATSCYVGDNTDIILQREALLLIKKMLVNTIFKAVEFAEKYKALPCLAYTHFQSAQPTTLGKRATLWIQDLVSDLEHLEFVLSNLKLLGCRGTTGTAASFLELFNGDHKKCKELEKKIASTFGFNEVYPVSGQTYSRKVDYYTVSVLSGIAQSAYKFSNDVRLMSHLKEAEEPFESGQVGSSAMAYKRNPMRSERIASLSRYIMVDALNPALTASGQWFERTLDDSANKRLSVPEAFLATDAVLTLFMNVVGGLTVYPKIIENRLRTELPFMATENILMHCVKKGGDRQQLHEKIRVLSVDAAFRIKSEGKENNLLERIVEDKAFNLTREELDGIVNNFGAFTGRAKEQTEEYLAEVKKILEKNKKLIGFEAKISV